MSAHGPRRAWTRGDDRYLRDRYHDMSVSAMADRLDRTVCAVYARAHYLSLPRKGVPWARLTDRVVAKSLRNADSVIAVSRELSVSESALRAYCESGIRAEGVHDAYRACSARGEILSGRKKAKTPPPEI